MGMKHIIKLHNVVEPIDRFTTVIKAELIDWLAQRGLVRHTDYNWYWPQSISDEFDDVLYITFNDQNLATLCKLAWISLAKSTEVLYNLTHLSGNNYG